MTTTQKIKEAMNRKGMSQSDVCTLTGMQPTLLARMLRDNDHNYTIKTLNRIAAALDTDLAIEFGMPGMPDEAKRHLLIGGPMITLSDGTTISRLTGGVSASGVGVSAMWSSKVVDSDGLYSTLMGTTKEEDTDE